jgi:hypothetical protein
MLAVMDAETILTDYTLAAAVTTLRGAGFRTWVLEKGTICAYRGKASYGFQPRHGRFSKEAITRAIHQERPS